MDTPWIICLSRKQRMFPNFWRTGICSARNSTFFLKKKKNSHPLFTITTMFQTFLALLTSLPLPPAPSHTKIASLCREIRSLEEELPPPLHTKHANVGIATNPSLPTPLLKSQRYFIILFPLRISASSLLSIKSLLLTFKHTEVSSILYKNLPQILCALFAILRRLVYSGCIQFHSPDSLLTLL